MANQVDYRDPTPNNFPQDYDPSKVDSRVKLRSESIKHKQKGKHTREAMYQALEIGSVTANEAKGLSLTTAKEQSNLNQRVDDQISAGTIKDEEIDFRHSDMLKKTFETMRKRGDFYDNEFTDRGVNVKWFGAVGDGVTDDTAAFESAIAAAKDYSGRVVIGNGTYLINLTLTTSGITLTGGGAIKGSINLDSPIDADNMQPSLDFKITDLNFKSDGTSDYAIGLNKARDGVISNCTFDNTVSSAIKFVGTPTYNQMSARINVINCRFNGDYAFYCVHNTAYFPLADIHFNDNVCQNKIANIHVIGVDGLALSGNTLFLPGNAKRDFEKEQNIYIRRGMWIVIDAANHLFEAGLEGILLDQCQSPVINGVSIAWPGQRKPSDGIRVLGGDMEGKTHVMGNISGCNIVFPTKSGISIENNSGGTVISGNKIKSAGYSGYYYGIDDLTTINHYGIVTEATTSSLLITGNNSAENNNYILGQANYYADNFDVDKNVISKNRVFELKTTDTVISVKGRDTIILNQPQLVDLTGFVDGYDGQDVLLIALNANTKILASAVYLNNHVDLHLGAGYAIKISYQSGNWYQIGGNV
ncbi:glycosyl hydrolase family 28-related protein [Latilactobacillus curvatus]